MGKLVMILSCMFSGKTETLISFARRYVLSKKKVVLIKYSEDTRYSFDEICSHNRTSIKATFSCKNLTHILETPEIKEADVILIDEIQFFDDAEKVCDELARDKIVIVAGLNGNYKREEFPNISKLLPKCEEIIFLKAVCTICGEDAHFTKRTIPNSSLQLIDGLESYNPRCRKCFDKL